VISQQESDRRFIGGFRWDYLPFTGVAICENKQGWLSLLDDFTPAREEVTQAQYVLTLLTIISSYC